jgi:hypothetical protein
MPLQAVDVDAVDAMDAVASLVEDAAIVAVPVSARAVTTRRMMRDRRVDVRLGDRVDVMVASFVDGIKTRS